MKFFFSIFLILSIFCHCAPNQQDQADQSTATTPEPVAEQSKPAFVDLNVQQFKNKMKEDNIVILDVRTPEETAEGMIEGAIEIDFRDDTFEEKIASLDKDKTYLVYCRSGGRSVNACNHMASQEFKSLYNLLGGYTDWKEAPE